MWLFFAHFVIHAVRNTTADAGWQPHHKLVFMTWHVQWVRRKVSNQLWALPGARKFCRLAACFFLTENRIFFNLVGGKKIDEEEDSDLKALPFDGWISGICSLLAHLCEADKALFSLKSSH